MTAARVLNPVVLSEFCKMRASPAVVGRNLPCGRQLNRIKRDLFGTGNAVETTKSFTEELEKHQERANKKWGFDFRAGCPLSANSQFIWERVGYQESSYVPEMYTLTRAAHVRPQDVDYRQHTDMDMLMDERAERENYASCVNSSISTDNESCYDSQDESISVTASTLAVFKMPARRSSSSSSAMSSSMLSQFHKRQPKITEYMKERKRLVQTPKKLSPATKRTRTNSFGHSSNSSANSIGSLGIHYSPLKRQRNNY